MSTLLYDIRLEEEYHGSNNTYRHLTKARREECFEQLDNQMTDGFGESYDQAAIPGADPGWVLYL